MGRFLQRDPLGYGPDPNLYAYADSSVPNTTDPDGCETGRAGEARRAAQAARRTADAAARAAEEAATRLQYAELALAAHWRRNRFITGGCDAWRRWNRWLEKLEAKLDAAEAAAAAAAAAEAAATAAAEASEAAYDQAVSDDIADNGFGGLPPGYHELEVDGERYWLWAGENGEWRLGLKDPGFFDSTNGYSGVNNEITGPLFYEAGAGAAILKAVAATLGRALRSGAEVTRITKSVANVFTTGGLRGAATRFGQAASRAGAVVRTAANGTRHFRSGAAEVSLYVSRSTKLWTISIRGAVSQVIKIRFR
jgi:hypothetical protein